MPVFFPSQQLSQNTNNCVFLDEKFKKNPEREIDICYHSNNFSLKTLQATKVELHKIYIHLFTEKCSHTGIDEIFNNSKIH